MTIGVLATVLLQSSSTTTSIVVAMVGAESKITTSIYDNMCTHVYANYDLITHEIASVMFTVPDGHLK